MAGKPIRLSKRDTKRFLDALDAGVKPSAALVKAAKEYYQAILEGRLEVRG